MNTKIFKALANSSNLENLRIVLNELGDVNLSDRIGLMLVDKYEILTKANISTSKLIKLIEIEYENRRNIVVKNINNIDNFAGYIYANISYDKVKFSKIENDTKESSDLYNYPDEEYKYPVVIDHFTDSNVSVSFLNYDGTSKDIFDYDTTEINKDELQMLINNRNAILLDKEDLLEELTSIEYYINRGDELETIKSISSLKKKIYETN